VAETTNARTLTITTPGDREIAMTRVFDAPRRLVFEALTKPEHLLRWFAGPPGWTLATCEVDLRVGGAYRYVWQKDSGTVMGMGGRFLEIVPPERIVATEKFDQSWYPGEAVVTQSLTETGGKTTLTLTVRYESKEARDGVLASPAASGVEYTYNRLAEFLQTMEA
jgi:uncharacterized protein YndB with AHSA1/START domain